MHWTPKMISYLLFMQVNQKFMHKPYYHSTHSWYG